MTQVMGTCVECSEVKLIKARGLCAVCYNRRQKTGEFKACSGYCNGEHAQPSRPSKSKPAQPSDFKVSVDFGPAAHILQEIRQRAESELRPLSMQILWELKRSVYPQPAAEVEA